MVQDNAGRLCHLFLESREVFQTIMVQKRGVHAVHVCVRVWVMELRALLMVPA